MPVKKDSTVTVFCSAAVVIAFVSLIVAMMMANSVVPVGKSTGEILRVADQIDSVSSIRTILFSYAQQFNVAENNLTTALNTALGLLTLLALLIVGLVMTLLHHQRRIRSLRAKLHQLQHPKD